MNENEIAKEIAKEIVDAAYQIHRQLGPGLLELVYEAVMAYELEKRGLKIVRQKPIPIIYEKIHLQEGFRADIIVENKVIIELKSVENLAPVHKKQLLTYLRLTNKKLGLLINFNTELIKDGITRIANNL
jgi:GxxExxY protein